LGVAPRAWKPTQPSGSLHVVVLAVALRLIRPAEPVASLEMLLLLVLKVPL